MSTELSPIGEGRNPLADFQTRAEIDAEAGAGGVPQWRRYLLAVWRAKWIVLLVTALGAAGGIVATRYVSLRYAAEATLWVETTGRADANTGPIRSGELLQSYAWIELLRSYTLLDHTVRELRLNVQPQQEADEAVLATLSVGEQYQTGSYRLAVDSTGRNVTLSLSDGTVLERAPAGAPVGAALGFRWAPPAGELRPGRVVAFDLASVRDEATALLERLRTDMARESNFLSLTLEGDDPEETARALDSLSRRYVELAAQLKRAKLDELTGVLDEQLRYSEQNLRDAEAALEGFRVQTITLPSDDAVPVAAGLTLTQPQVLSSFFDLKVDREQLRREREALESIAVQVRDSSMTIAAMSSVPAIAQSPTLVAALGESAQKRAELRALLQRYTEEYEPVRRLQADIRQLEEVVLPGQVAELRGQLLAQEQLLDSQISSASEELEQIPPRAIEEARLERQVAIANNLHTTLRQRFEEARLAAASSIPDIRVLDAPTIPTAPVSDQRPILLLLALFGSFGLAAGGAVLKEMLDPRVRYPEQITLGLGLPILGAIPRVEKSKRDDNSVHVIEAFREIRLAVSHAYGAAGPVLLTVTSAESGDGKSFTTANLAVAFAQRGDRTLVIDGDLRRGQMHRLLGGQRVPGLTDYLAQAAPLHSVVQPSNRENLWFIGSGTRRADAPELLGTPAMGTLLTTLRSQFDVILVDSPPLGAGTDPYLLATLTRDVLVVVRNEATDRSFVEAKVQLMDRLPVRILGAVLNDFVAGSMYRYYTYLPGYEARDGDEEALRETSLVLSAGSGSDRG